MAKRTQAPAIEVRLLREGIVESKHIVQAVLCDERGRVLSVAGTPKQLHLPVLRSSHFKP